MSCRDPETRVRVHAKFRAFRRVTLADQTDRSALSDPSHSAAGGQRVVWVR
jgi:hypothetical protein